ncbi:MAG: class B sortase [Oscillospiraceae bacterium]|nr:class B sortase [Oscillospiraceae bacterium]
MNKILCLILSLLILFSLSVPLAGSLDNMSGEVDVSITGREALVFELRMAEPGEPGKTVPVSAEEEEELLGGKSCIIALGAKGSGIGILPLSRSPGRIVLRDLQTKDLIISPPSGYYVSRVYLRGDAVTSQYLKPLPFTAEATRPRVILRAGALFEEDNSFLKKYLTTGSSSDPQVYTLSVVLAPLDREKGVTVTEALDHNDRGTQRTVKPGIFCKVPAAPEDMEQRVFACWRLTYRSGAALLLNPGQRYRPFADCRLEAQWMLVIPADQDDPSGKVKLDDEVSPLNSMYDLPRFFKDYPDAVGWIYCPGTPIDNGVVQAKTNDYYLHRFYDGSYSVGGSLFADCGNARDFSDRNTVIYGHHMKDGSKFARITFYRNQSYYDEHPVMYLNTPGMNYRVEIFAAFATDADSEVYTLHFESEAAYEAWLQLMKDNSDFKCNVDVAPTDRVVTLSTCSYEYDDSRYVAIGKLVPIH